MLNTVLLSGGVSTGVLLGGMFGARHALEADHVAAVATLVDDRQRPMVTGATWGIGHSLPILLLGTSVLVMDLQIPTRVTQGFEAVVAAILIVLGARILAGRAPVGTTLPHHGHSNDGSRSSRGHQHLSIGSRELGLIHAHADGESFAVGIVHGLAGSGGIVVLLTAGAPTLTQGAAFLAGFAIASLLAMGAAAWVWGRLDEHAGGLRVLAGLVSMSMGLWLFVGLLGGTVSF